MGTPVVTPEVTPAKVEFSAEQQEHINNLFNQRFAKITSKHDAEMKAMSEKLEELKVKADEVKPPVVTPAPTATEKEKEEEAKRQMKAYLDQEKLATNTAKQQVRTEQEANARLLAENKRILKNQAITEALTSMAGGLEFHNIQTVKKLVEDTIAFDEESGQWVVKENGQIKLNNSMNPMTLAEYFPMFAAANTYLVKGTAKAGSGSAESGKGFTHTPGSVKSRSDIKTTKEKVDFISKHGYEAWEKLPVR